MRVLLIPYDNKSYINFVPIGLAYIARVLIDHGHEVDIYQQDINHEPDSKITELLDETVYDMVGLSFTAGYYQFKKLGSMCEAINASKNRPFLVVGGHMCTPDPAYFINKFDIDCVVMGEGEQTVLEIMDYLDGKIDLDKMTNVAMKEFYVHIAPSGCLIKDIDTIPFPAYDKFDIQHYRLVRMPNCNKDDFVMPMLSGRGCHFKCNFCYRMDKGFRARSAANIVAEMKYLHETYSINYFSFADELLMSSVERTIELCDAFINSGIPNLKWDCNGRLNYAFKDVLLKMKQSGCVFINYGIEAYDDQVLKNMNKCLTVKQINEGITTTLEAGVSPGFNILWGNIGDTEETLRKGTDFLLAHDDHSQMRTIRFVTPYPGSPLFDYAVEHGLLDDVADFYEHKHKNSDLMTCDFMGIGFDRANELLYEANMRLIKNYFDNQYNSYDKQSRALYLDGDASFRGYRQS